MSLVGPQRPESSILTRLLWDLDVLGTYRTSGDFWAGCIKFLEMTTSCLLGIVGFNLQEKLEEVEGFCAGADSVALATVFWEALRTGPEQGPDVPR